MIKEIIEKNLKRIEKDLKEIEGLQKIDFIDIFPTSENHKIVLDEEISKISKIVKKTERGNVYFLNKPIETKYGKLEYVKIRIFDETRLNWEAAADFVVENRDILKKKVGTDKRYSYIKRPEWDAVEFKTKDTLVYFLNPLASKVYGRNKINMNKGIIFDLDGTLWEVTDATYNNLNRVAKKYNLEEIKLETVKILFGRNTLECARLCFPSLNDEKAVELINEGSIELNNELKEKGGNLYPNLEDTLKKLSNEYMLFIVSNSGHTEYIEAFLNSSGLNSYFKDYIAASALKITKAEGIQKVIYDYKLEKAVYVGDMIKDLEAAKIANIPFIHAKYGYMEKLESEYSIESIDQLPNIVKEII